DTPTYLLPAQTLLNTGQYAANDQPELLRPPGYPFFLIPGIFANALIFITLTLQIILSVITVALVYYIAHTLTNSRRTAQFAGFLAAIEPLGVLYTNHLLTETLFTALLTAGLYALLQAHQKSTLRPLIIAAILLAAATYVRPIGIYLPCILAIPLALSRWPWQRLAIFLVIALGLPSLWTLRNIAVANYPNFSAISAVNLYFYQGAAVKAEQKQIYFVEYQNHLGYRDQNQYLAHHPGQKNWSPAQRYQYMAGEGLNTLMTSPVTYAIIHFKGIFRTLFDPGAIDLLKLLNAYPERGGLLGQISDRGLVKALGYLLTERPFVFWTHICMGILLLVYYFFALLILKTKIRLPAILLLTTICYFTILSGGPHSLNRFRHPIMPIIAVFAGTGMGTLKRLSPSK
ncbi:MAG: glycosyltransferase family 39 protein, partial [Candidatus Latescibacteria bacterium]|nr:glycosyltransferase family 39 protein [Candidatus Latescibacterota bacterium]